MSISAGAQRQMNALLAAQPEAGPWLGLLSIVLEECANPGWDASANATRLRPECAPGTPLLAGAQIPVDALLAERWLRRVLALAGNAGPEAASLRAAATSSALDPLAILETAVNADDERLGSLQKGMDGWKAAEDRKKGSSWQ